MKYLIILFIFLSGYTDEFYTQYDLSVNNAYEEYVEEVYEHPNYPYGIKLIKGIMDGQVRYGFAFYNKNANPSQSYYIRIEKNDKLYKVDTDSRGDIQVVALDLEAGDTFSILLFESKTDNHKPQLKLENIVVMDLEDFNNLENTISGKGLGTALTRLRSASYLDFNILLLLGTIFILIGCALIIFIFFKRRKGLFSPELRTQNVFNFREFLSSSFEESIPAEESVDIAPPAEAKENDQIHRVYLWSREEDERSDFNIGEHLRNRGFITDYHLLGEDEKNQIMLELMHLRNQGLITKDDYLEEISKLWKR